MEPSFSGQSESLVYPSASENESSRYGLDEAFIMECSGKQSASQLTSSKVAASTDLSKQSDHVNTSIAEVKVIDQDLSIHRCELQFINVTFAKDASSSINN